MYMALAIGPCTWIVRTGLNAFWQRSVPNIDFLWKLLIMQTGYWLHHSIIMGLYGMIVVLAAEGSYCGCVHAGCRSLCYVPTSRDIWSRSSAAFNCSRVRPTRVANSSSYQWVFNHSCGFNWTAFAHVTVTLLPVNYRIRYKLGLLTYLVVTGHCLAASSVSWW